MYFLITFRPN